MPPIQQTVSEGIVAELLNDAFHFLVAPLAAVLLSAVRHGTARPSGRPIIGKRMAEAVGLFAHAPNTSLVRSAQKPADVERQRQ
jgi:hypothetical protein